MSKKTIILGLLLTMGLGIFTGCSTGIRFKVGYESGDSRFVYTDDVVDLDIVKIINSHEELKAFCDEVNNPAFNEDSPKYSNYLSKKIREYDETFFAEKSLIIYLTTASKTGVSYSIKGLVIEDEELILHVRRKEYKGDHLPEVTPWVFLIEVNKEDVIGITNIKIK